MKIEQLMEKLFNVLDKVEELEGLSFFAETDGGDQVTSVSINFESCKINKDGEKYEVEPDTIPTKVTTSDKVSDLKTEYVPYYKTGPSCITGVQTKVTYTTPDPDCKIHAIGDLKSAITTTASTDNEVIVIDGSALSKPCDVVHTSGMSCVPVEGDE